MSSSGTSASNGNKKRNLPSWMSSRRDEDKSDGKNPEDFDAHDEIIEGETGKDAKVLGNAQSKKSQSVGKSSGSNSGATNFSKLLEGVVFVLSGFVNPERGQLRSQALEMGAEYQADWNSSCTLLVCAFPNTPKFRQVEADCGTIVSKVLVSLTKSEQLLLFAKSCRVYTMRQMKIKYRIITLEWILECYNKKKLVDIESYLMHAGKPWRRQSTSRESSQGYHSTSRESSQVLADKEPRAPRKSPEKVVSRANSTSAAASSSKNVASNPCKDSFPPLEVKKWAADDLEKTVSWLESQDEMPEPSEIKKIAAQGILTCLQDAIDSLKKGQSINQVTDEWNFIPRVVEELIKLEGKGGGVGSVPKKDLHKQAVSCKEIYEAELGNLNNESSLKNKKQKTDNTKTRKQTERNQADSDSDKTIEMTEEEIDRAYNDVVSKLDTAS